MSYLSRSVPSHRRRLLCRFTRIEFDAGEGVRFPSDGKVYVLFVLSGSLMLEQPEQPARLVTSKQCVCLERDAVCQVTAQDGGTCVVVLSLLHHMEFCEQDIFGEGPLPGTAIPAVQMPVLTLHPVVEQLLSSFFLVHGMADCERSLPTFKKSVPVGGCKTSVRRRAQGARREEGGWTLIRYIFAEVAQLIEH